MGKAKRYRSSKVSVAKIKNKRLNKLAKQGKLKKKKDKLKRNVQKQDEKEKTKGRYAENYFSASAQNGDLPSDEYSEEESEEFSDVNKRKRKANNGDAFNEEDFEKAPRKIFRGDDDRNMKPLLPIKVKNKVIPQMVHTKQEQNDSSSDEAPSHDEEDGEKDEKPSMPQVTSVELFMQRKRMVLESKKRIAQLSSVVIENPEENIGKLKELRELLTSQSSLTVIKLTMVSLMEVFKDIIPGYKIRLLTEQEKEQKIKKDTKKLIRFEESLLKNYRCYLEFLENTAKVKNKQHSKMSKFNKNKLRCNIPEDVSMALSQLAIKCLCEMLITHPNFNYRNNIVAVIIPFLTKNKEVCNNICETITQLFVSDKSGEITLEFVRSIGRLIKSRNYKVKPKVLETYLSLNIKEINEGKSVDQKEVDRKKSRLDRLSRREKKERKEMKKLETELLEIKATEDKKKKTKLHTEIIHAIFLTYFRILKNAPESILLPPVLAGLAKFAHLINVEFFNDLFLVFDSLINSQMLSFQESLHVVQTAFTILSGQGSLLNIDPVKFYKHLYGTLPKVNVAENTNDLPTLLHCCDIMINRRRGQLNQQRVLAFLKRISTMLLQQSLPATMALLAVVRQFIQNFKYAEKLFDTESIGSGVYLPELDDPEHCNAQNTTVWELHTLRKFYHPDVRLYANHVCRVPTIAGQLPNNMTRKLPLELYRLHDCSDVANFKMPEKIKRKTVKKKQMEAFLQADLQETASSFMRLIPDIFPT